MHDHEHRTGRVVSARSFSGSVGIILSSADAFPHGWSLNNRININQCVASDEMVKSRNYE